MGSGSRTRWWSCKATPVILQLVLDQPPSLIFCWGLGPEKSWGSSFVEEIPGQMCCAVPVVPGMKLELAKTCGDRSLEHWLGEVGLAALE